MVWSDRYSVTRLSGRCAADKGYQRALFEAFCERGMGQLPVGAANAALLRHRPLIEGVNDILAAVIAGQYLPVKTAPFHT